MLIHAINDHTIYTFRSGSRLPSTSTRDFGSQQSKVRLVFCCCDKRLQRENTLRAVFCAVSFLFVLQNVNKTIGWKLKRKVLRDVKDMSWGGGWWGSYG